MSIPSWYEALLLALASFRVWKLLGDDAILDRPRKWMLGWVQGRYGNGGVVRANEFLECPWCLGFWVGVVWWGFWEAWPHGTTIAAVPFALAALVGLLGDLLSD